MGAQNAVCRKNAWRIMYSNPLSIARQALILAPNPIYNAEVQFIHHPIHGWQAIAVYRSYADSLFKRNRITTYQTKTNTNETKTVLVATGDFNSIPKIGFCKHPHKLIAWKKS